MAWRIIIGIAIVIVFGFIILMGTITRERNLSQATATPEAMPQKEVALPASVPTASISMPDPVEAMLPALVACEQIRVEMTIRWGQLPATIYSDNPRFSGQLEIGDSFVLLSRRPEPSGEIRVQVDPHDGRRVTATANKVWIDLGTLALNDFYREALSCVTTPTPTPTLGCPTRAEAVYLLELGEGFETIGNYFAQWSSELERVEHNSSLLVDDDWRLGVTLLVAAIFVEQDRLLSIDRPTSANFIYREVDEIFALQKRALEQFIASLDRFDFAVLEQAGLNLDAANAKAVGAVALIEDFCNQRESAAQ